MRKTSILLTLAICGYSLAHAGVQTPQQQTDRKKTQAKQKVRAATDTAQQETEKSINTGTTGVMGRDTIRLNEKGLELNTNYNTGTELPPSSGTNSEKEK
jgi:hypothetical protein